MPRLKVALRMPPPEKARPMRLVGRSPVLILSLQPSHLSADEPPPLVTSPEGASGPPPLDHTIGSMGSSPGASSEGSEGSRKRRTRLCLKISFSSSSNTARHFNVSDGAGGTAQGSALLSSRSRVISTEFWTRSQT